MASQFPIHTRRRVAGEVRRALFPSRLGVLVAVAVEGGALLVGLSPAAHLALAVFTHLAIALCHTTHLGRPRSRPRTGPQRWR
jgi:hypothetical protein